MAYQVVAAAQRPLPLVQTPVVQVPEYGDIFRPPQRVHRVPGKLYGKDLLKKHWSWQYQIFMHNKRTVKKWLAQEGFFSNPPNLREDRGAQQIVVEFVRRKMNEMELDTVDKNSKLHPLKFGLTTYTWAEEDVYQTVKGLLQYARRRLRGQHLLAMDAVDDGEDQEEGDVEQDEEGNAEEDKESDCYDSAAIHEEFFSIADTYLQHENMSFVEKKQVKERIHKLIVQVKDIGGEDEEMLSILDDLETMDKALNTIMGRKKRKVQDIDFVYDVVGKTSSKNKSTVEVIVNQMDPVFVIMNEYSVHDVDEMSTNIDKYIGWEIKKAGKKGRVAKEFKGYRRWSTIKKIEKLAKHLQMGKVVA